MKEKKTRRWLSAALALIMMVSVLPVTSLAADTTDTQETTGQPFKQGTLDSNSYRIPAMVTLNDGTLVAAADARWNTTYDGGGLDTAVAYSDDDGETWTNYLANYLGDNGNEYNGKLSTAFIDPALAYDGDDTIYMLCDLYPYGVALNGNKDTDPVSDVGFNNDGTLKLKKTGESKYSYYLKGDTIYDSNGTAVSGCTVDEYFNIESNGVSSNLFFADSPYQVVRTGYLYLTKSTDGGRSWSAPTLIPNVKTSSEQACLVGPGRGLVTNNGTIVFPVYSYNNGVQQMGFIYSEDGGETWTREDFTGAAWSSEAAVVELKDGTLRFFYRNGTTKLCYADYVWGEGWVSVVMTPISTNSNTQISAISLDKTVNGQQVILVSCPTGFNYAGSNQTGASYRLNGRIQIGLVNENKTMSWQNPIDVSNNQNDPFMYSCLTALKDSEGVETGKVAILYEDCESKWGVGSDCYYTMSFKTYDLAKYVTFDSASAESNVYKNEKTGVQIDFGTQSYNKDGITISTAEVDALSGRTYAAYDFTVPDFSGSAKVTIPLSDALQAAGKLYAVSVNADGTLGDRIEGTRSGNQFTFTATHFSTYAVVAETADVIGTPSEKGETIELFVGAEKTVRDDSGYYTTYSDGPNTSVATVALSGQEGTAASVDYKNASVFCDDLISSNYSTWQRAGNYYYTPDNEQNYYPVYAKRSGSWRYTYTWGYGTSSDNVTPIGKTQNVNSWSAGSTAPSITVYTQFKTDAKPGYTQITFTGVAAGETSVKVGSKVYPIVVKEIPPVVDINSTPFLSGTGSNTGKKVTKLTTSVGKEYTLTLADGFSGGSWSSGDAGIATVENGVITGVSKGTTTVTYTVNGNAYTIPVVVRNDYGKNTYDYTCDLYIDEITNTSVAYSINLSTDMLATQEGEVIYLGFDYPFCINFFGKQDVGYALTYMSATGTDDQYYPLEQTDDVTSLDAYKNGALHWQAVEWTNETGAVLVQNLLKTAVDNGYNGTMGFTRTQNNEDINKTSLTFRSEKLPTVSKTVAGILGTTGLTKDYREYKPGMTAVVGETVYFKIDVTTYEATNLITYTNVKLKDTMTGRFGYSFLENRVATGKTEQDITTTIDGDGLKGGTHTYYVAYKLTKDDLDTDITNDVSLTFDYQAQYSKGKFNGSADANAKISAASFAPQDIVIDFGLPVTIDYSQSHGSYNLSSGTALHGKVTVTNNQVTYTPGADFLKAASDTVTLKNEKGLEYTFKVIPASNVLYEDNFLTVNTSKGKSYADWKTGPSEITAQQTADPNTLYGYDNAYASSTGNSMGSAWTITGLKEGEGSKYLTTTFNGTGFDLIGTSGPNTGYVYLVLQGPENRVVVIDTSYGEGTLHQVPLAHLDGLKAGTYTVNIRAAYRAAPVTSTAAGTNSIAAYSLQNAKADALNDVYEEVESMLPAGMDLDDCEFVYADSESPLAELDNSSVAAYALTADEVSTAAAVTRTAGTTVTIDGFRVYRDANNPAYTESEQGVQYVNVMKAKINNDAGSFTAYVEGNKGSQWTQANYEANGGPQNEVYLGNGHAIAFKVNTNKPIQISARAVSGEAQLVVNGTSVKELTSNTEMYYEVTADANGIITIKNGETGMLALGNLKLPADTSTQALTAADEEIVLSLLSMDPAPAFAPKLSAAARSFKVIRNKLVTVTVHASTDVARLTINGKTVSPTNGLLVKRGWSKEYIYLFTDTVKRDVSKTYEIIAYNADGTASAPVQVTG